MAAGAVVIWTAVVLLGFYAVRVHPDRGGRRSAILIIGGGAIVPTIVLALLLLYGLSIMPPLLASAPEGALRIAVTGEQWWWRVRYQTAAGPVELANEIRLPAGEPVEFHLDSPDVIHSFWIPSLGGKMDMIPGRQTRLVLEPTRTGVYRGACAEYCGTSHALMAFPVVVMEREDFARWLERERASAAEPGQPVAANGRRIFFSSGCPACHTIRGTTARGVVGPDLTHVGSRLTLGAGIIRNDADGFVRWIESTDSVKPGVHMPSFGMLSREELIGLAAYLDSLE